jgi:hypothetical protein
MKVVHHVPCHENGAENTNYSKDVAEGHIKQSNFGALIFKMLKTLQRI